MSILSTAASTVQSVLPSISPSAATEAFRSGASHLANYAPEMASKMTGSAGMATAAASVIAGASYLAFKNPVVRSAADSVSSSCKSVWKATASRLPFGSEAEADAKPEDASAADQVDVKVAPVS